MNEYAADRMFCAGSTGDGGGSSTLLPASPSVTIPAVSAVKEARAASHDW
jgi:hypothetical protein